MTMKSDESVWIFAYGSLCWRPGFEYEEKVVGTIKGFVRRFWQGNTVHRGTTDKPGRVATLLPDVYGETGGCAFKVPSGKAQRTLKYLENRETKLGGYDSKVATFYPTDKEKEVVRVILYIALPGNVDWRGPAKLSDIADEVLTATGVCGSNLDYVTDLASFLRNNDFQDSHLFELEEILLSKMEKMKLRALPKAPSKGSLEDSSSSSSSDFDTETDVDVDTDSL